MAEIGSPEWQMNYYQQQMNQLRSPTGGIGMMDTAAYDHLRNLYDQSRNQVILSNRQASSQSQDDAAAEAARRREQILEQTLGAKESMLADPALLAAQDFYSRTLSGEGTPYNQEVQNLMNTQAVAGLTAGETAARQALQEQLARTGASMSDPSAMAAVRSFETQRMRGTQDIATQIALQAAQANYAAQQAAASGLTNARMGQLNSANQLGLVGAQYLNTPIQDNSGGGFSGTISYGGFRATPTVSQPRSVLPQQNSYIQSAQSRAPQPRQQSASSPRQAGGASSFVWPTDPNMQSPAPQSAASNPADNLIMELDALQQYYNSGISDPPGTTYGFDNF